jgi:hypothetical protein
MIDHSPMKNMTGLQRGLLLVALLPGFSCEEGSPEPSLRGDFIGVISVVLDEFGRSMADRGGYEVTFEGSDPEQKAVSDADGKFVVEDLQAGTYNLIFARPGFETRKVFSVQFTGGNVPTYYYAPLLSQLPSTSITGFTISVTDHSNPDPNLYTMLKIEATTLPEPTLENPRTLVVYVHTDHSVSESNYSFSQLNVTNNNALIRLDKISSGTTLYAIAYPTSVSCNSYYDPARSLYVNPCLGSPTPVVEFNVP